MTQLTERQIAILKRTFIDDMCERIEKSLSDALEMVESRLRGSMFRVQG